MGSAKRVTVSFLVLVSSAFAQSVPPPPPGPIPGPPPAPDLSLLEIQSRRTGPQPALPPIQDPTLPGGANGRPMLMPPPVPAVEAKQDGVTLKVTARYVKSFERFHVEAHVEGDNIEVVDYTGPGRFGTSIKDKASGFKLELDTDKPFTLRARVHRTTREKPTPVSLDVAPVVLSMPLKPGLTPDAVTTKMRTGGYQYELKLKGEVAGVVATEWTLPEGFKETLQRSSDASTGFAVTGDFDKEFPAAVRVLFADGSIGLAVLKVEPKD